MSTGYGRTENLAELGRAMLAQDVGRDLPSPCEMLRDTYVGRCLEWPVFVVIERVKRYNIDVSAIDPDGTEPPGEDSCECEDEVICTCDRVPYVHHWQPLPAAVFFLEADAERFIERHGHDFDKLAVAVESANRNRPMREMMEMAITSALVGPFKEEGTC